MYSEMVVEDNWDPTPWPPEVRACALPNAQWVFYVALGAAVVAAALMIWGVRRIAG
jgi:hypothetical protein